MGLVKFTKQRGSVIRLQLSKNSPKKTVKQVRSWISNELNFNKGKKLGRKEWEKKYRNKG